MKILRCPICRRVRTVPRKQHTCSRACGQLLEHRQRGSAFYRQAGHKGGVVSGAKARDRALALWRVRFPTVSPEAALQIYTRGYNAGHATATRQAYARGWEACIRAMEQRA